MSAGGALRESGLTLINYKGGNISKCIYLTVIIDITRKITKFVNLKIFMRNDDVIIVMSPVTQRKCSYTCSNICSYIC